MLSVEVATSADAGRWNSYVRARSPDHCAHLWEWREIISSVFGHTPVYLMAVYGPQEIRGVLPLFHVKSLLFGSSLISVPYLNSGGVLADDEVSFRALIDRADREKKDRNVRYVELRARDASPFYRAPSGFPLTVRTHKVAMRLQLPGSEEELMNGFDKKLRAQIRRPAKDGVTSTVSAGSAAALDDFYSVFSENMRDLGTPVYPKALWSKIFELLPEASRCIVAYHGSVPVAAAVTIGTGESTEISWASSLRRFNNLSPNMLLYFETMKAAIKDGYTTFDFGRSSRDSGTFKFKAQWGAKPKPLHWYYIALSEDVPDVNPSSAKFTVMVSVWRKLPLPVTKMLGPWLTRNIP